MIKRRKQDGNRHSNVLPYMTPEISSVLSEVETQTGDSVLAQSIYFSPTAITHIKRILENGGSIITDTTLTASGIDTATLTDRNVKTYCFIDDDRVKATAEQRKITRAEIAADIGLSIPGPKLMVVGSAPAAINRMLYRRQLEPMNDVCILAAATGFASVVQLKEKLMDSNLTAIIVRGKKGGIPATVAILNALIHELCKRK